MKTKLIRDVPIGALLIVLSLWCISIVQYLSNWPEFLTLLGIVVASVLGQRLLLVGIDVIVGIQIEDKND
jgi:4-hydroxybenzoate polyprenyltransferase